MSEVAARKPGVNWPILAGGLAVVAALVGVLASGFGKDPRAWSDARSGEMAPAFALETMEGAPISLADLRGSPVVLNFWATWCQPCAVEHPIVVDAASRFKPRGVRFFGVLYNDEEKLARSFLEKRGSAFPTLLDPTGRMSVDYGITGVPETFVLDKEGRIVKKFTGPVQPGELDAALEPLL